MINELLGHLVVEIRALHKTQEELVDGLHMWPSQLRHRLILIWIKQVTNRVDRRRNWSEQVLLEHSNHMTVHFLCVVESVAHNELNQLL